MMMVDQQLLQVVAQELEPQVLDLQVKVPLLALLETDTSLKRIPLTMMVVKMILLQILKQSLKQ